MFVGWWWDSMQGTRVGGTDVLDWCILSLLCSTAQYGSFCTTSPSHKWILLVMCLVVYVCFHLVCNCVNIR
jgi:hypothetical protein